MSKDQDILIIEANALELRLSHVCIGTGPVRLLDSYFYVAQEEREGKSAIQDREVLDALLALVSERDWVGKDLILLLGGNAVSCQYFDMPPLQGQALREAVLLKLGQQLHFDVSDAIVDIQSIKPGRPKRDGELRVAVNAVRHEASQAAIDAAARLGLNVLAVSCVPAALAVLAQEVGCQGDDLQGMLHVGERVSTLIVLNAKYACVTSELPIGLSDFTTSLMRPIIAGDDVIQLDEEKATALRDEVGIPRADRQIESLGVAGSRLLPLIEPTLEKFALQLTQWLTFATTSEGAAAVSRMGVVGCGASMPGLARAIGQRIGIHVEEQDWLNGLLTITEGAQKHAPESFAATTAAARFWRNLPELIPPLVQKQRKLRRIRRSVSRIGPIVAVGVFAIAFLFDRVDAHMASRIVEHQIELQEIQKLVNVNASWMADRQAAERLQKHFDVFAANTPRWDGLFKELARLLPSELQVTEFQVRSHSGGIRMTVQADVYPAPQGRNFDEVLEQTLLSLERSPFFKRVQSLGSTAKPATRLERETGSLSVELELAYPRHEENV